MIVNSCFSVPCKVTVGADPFKTTFGKTAYTISVLLEAMKQIKQDLFDVELDGQQVTNHNRPNLGTILMFVNNGRSAGAGMVISPFSCLNDGLLDVTWIQEEKDQGFLGVVGCMDNALKGGIQAYDGS